MVKQTGKHIRFYSSPFLGNSKKIFMDGKCIFPHSIQHFVGIFRKMAIILGKCHVQHPVHRFNFSVFSCEYHQLFLLRIQTGNIIASFTTHVSALVHNTSANLYLTYPECRISFISIDFCMNSSIFIAHLYHNTLFSSSS